MSDPAQMTAAEVAKAVADEIPVIAEFFGDESAQVAETIDELIDKGVSQQIQDRIKQDGETFNEMRGDIASPPYDPFKLALLLEHNTRLNRSCHLRARNTVGLGWYVGPVIFDPDEEQAKEASVKSQKAKLKKLYGNPQPRRFERLNDNQPPLDFSEISYRSKVDEEATGNGYVEITRNNAGAIDGVYTIPAHTVRVRKSGGFVQVRGRKKRYFKKFGDGRVISVKTGKEEANLGPEDRATEILQFVIYSSRSSYYGIPRWISGVAAVQGSRLSAIRNIAFFENDSVGRLAIVVSGGALTPEAVNDIRSFVNREARGPEKAHRVMVLQAEPRRVVTGRDVATKIDIVPLTVGLTEDASFLGYRTANDEEVRESMGLSTPFFTAAGTNRACLTGDTRIPLLDGRMPTMRELVKYHKDEDFWVYACDGQKVVPGHAHSPRKMRTNVEVVSVLLDNGETLRATPDHLFMLRNGQYQEARKLRSGDRLMPFRQKIPTSGFNRGRRFYKRLSGGWEPVHSMVARETFGYDPKEIGELVHHRNFDRLDNTPNNLSGETHSSHSAIHMSARMADEDFREKANAARKAGWDKWAAEHPDDLIRMAELMGRANRERWKNDEFRKKMCEAFSRARSSPEAKKRFVDQMRSIINSPEFAQKLIERTRKLWADPGFRERQRAAVSSAAKKRWGSYTEAEKIAMLSPMRNACRNDDVTFEQIRDAIASTSSWQELCSLLGISRSRVLRILRDAGVSYADLRTDNHQVVSVSSARKTDVFDITVDKYHNFATRAGVFVHNSASILRKITIEQDLIPDLTSHEHIWNSTVSWSIIHGGRLATLDTGLRMESQLYYRKPRATDELELAQIQGMLARSGIVGVNEARKQLGLRELPKEFVYGQLPLPLALAFLEVGLLNQGAIGADGVEDWKKTVARIEEQRAREEAAKRSAPQASEETEEGKKAASQRPSLFSLGDATRAQIEHMTGLALGLKKLLKQSMGRDVLEAELILQGRDGEIFDRISLASLDDEED